MFHFPYLRMVPQDYSGCLNTWFEGNVRVLEAKFVNGKIKWYRAGNSDVFCEYENDRVTRQEVTEEVKRQMKETFPNYQFCPPGSELAPSKWR